MNKRRIYYRRKDKKIIIEGLKNGKTEYIWTLPEPEKLLRRFDPENLGNPENIKNSSFLPTEKYQKIMEKVTRLDYSEKK